jgi:hypothetical protein
VLGGDLAEHRHGQRHEAEPGADPDQHHRQQQVGEVAAGGVDPAQRQVRGGNQGKADEHDRTDPEPPDQARADP